MLQDVETEFVEGEAEWEGEAQADVKEPVAAARKTVTHEKRQFQETEEGSESE